MHVALDGGGSGSGGFVLGDTHRACVGGLESRDGNLIPGERKHQCLSVMIRGSSVTAGYRLLPSRLKALYMAVNVVPLPSEWMIFSFPS